MPGRVTYVVDGEGVIRHVFNLLDGPAHVREAERVISSLKLTGDGLAPTGKIWQLKPAQPVGQVDFIGGSYLAATPQVSYRRLLEDLSNSGLVINAWAYVRDLIIKARPGKPGSTSAALGNSSKSVTAVADATSARSQPGMQVAVAGPGWRQELSRVW